MLICHHCDNPRCVNPEHLFLGTYTDNNRDMFAKNRANTTNRVTGERHHSATLTDAQVAEIRRLYATNEYMLTTLAGMFGTTVQTVHRIVNNKTRLLR
jgi:hypothetical protein